jgi:hypothetical protein
VGAGAAGGAGVAVGAGSGAVTTGGTSRTTTVVAYSLRPPSRSRIAALIGSVAGPSGAVNVACGSVPLISKTPSPSRSYSYVKPAAASAAEGSAWSEKVTVAGAPSSTVSPVSVAVGAAFSTVTVAL